MLRRANGSIERLETGGIPFGIAPDAAYSSAAVQLAPGDRLLIFTDGLVEAVNEQGEEFSDARLLGLVSHSPEESAAALQARIMAELDAFVGRARQHDDTTCLVLRIS
jgi:sigma-B regulation protein RsbU (phosphoserine phosphatase)